MQIKHIEIQNLRIFEQYNVELHPLHTFIQGNNGKGKTTLVEAIYLLHNIRTFRKQSLKEIISFNKPYFRIEAHYDATTTETEQNDDDDYNKEQSNQQGVTSSLFYGQYNGELVKQLKSGVDGINEEVVKVYSSHVHLFPTFCYSPNADNILEREQEVRRKQLDKIIFSCDKHFAVLIREFNIILDEKKALLTNSQNGNSNITKSDFMDLYELYSNRLIKLATLIADMRKNYIKKINDILLEFYKVIESIEAPLPLFLEYSTNVYTLEKGDNSSTGSESIPKHTIEQELKSKTNIYGVHRDKISIKLIDEAKHQKSYEKAPSFGQKKLIMILSTLAGAKITIEHINKNKNSGNFTPIIILDDFEAGLDKFKINAIMTILDKCFKKQQIIFTGIKNSIDVNLTISVE